MRQKDDPYSKIAKNVADIIEDGDKIAKNLSPKALQIAHDFINNCDLLQACKNYTQDSKRANSLRFKLLQSTAFNQYLAYLRKHISQSVILNKDMILAELQKTFVQTDNAKSKAELAKVINSMEGYSAERKEVTIHLPEQVQQQFTHEPQQPKGIKKSEHNELMEKTQQRFQEVIDLEEGRDYHVDEE